MPFATNQSQQTSYEEMTGVVLIHDHIIKLSLHGCHN